MMRVKVDLGLLLTIEQMQAWFLTLLGRVDLGHRFACPVREGFILIRVFSTEPGIPLTCLFKEKNSILEVGMDWPQILLRSVSFS